RDLRRGLRSLRADLRGGCRDRLHARRRGGAPASCRAALDAAPGVRLRAQPRLAHAPPRPSGALARSATRVAGAPRLPTAALDRRRHARQEAGGVPGRRARLAPAAPAAAALRRLALVGREHARSRPWVAAVGARALGADRLPTREGRRDDRRALVGLAEV